MLWAGVAGAVVAVVTEIPVLVGMDQPTATGRGADDAALGYHPSPVFAELLVTVAISANTCLSTLHSCNLSFATGVFF